MPRTLVPRVLRTGAGHEVVVPATLVDSSATASFAPVDAGRAAALAEAAVTGGGVWLVGGEHWPRIMTGTELADEPWEPARQADLSLLFEGGPPLARLSDGLDPVGLIVPVASWEPGQSFYFHRESPLFATLPVVAKRNHRLTVLRGSVPEGSRKLIGRLVGEGQTCGVLTNELGGLCVVPDGEVATDVRALHAERVRFIVDGLRDLSRAARAIGEWAERFAAASAAGWVLSQPIENSFVYAVNRRRLRSLLPLPAPGALVPVGAPYDVPIPAGEEGILTAVLDDAGDAEPPVVPERSLAQDIVERLVTPLLDRATEAPAYGSARPPEGSMPVLRRNVFRQPRGSLLWPDSGSRLVVAELVVRVGQVHVVRGHLPDDVAGPVAAAVEAGTAPDGDWALCRGAFGYVLAEMGSPQRAVEAMSSTVSYAHLLDGSETLREAADRLAAVARQLDGLAAAGWTLSQPITGFWLRLRPPRPI